MVFSIHFYKFTGLGFPPLCPKPHKNLWITLIQRLLTCTLVSNLMFILIFYRLEENRYIFRQLISLVNRIISKQKNTISIEEGFDEK